MKKRIMLCICFIATIICMAPMMIQANSNLIIGQVNLAFSEDGKNLYENLKEATLELDELRVEGGTASFQGNISYNGNSYPIDARGEIERGYLSNESIVGKLFDNNGNFEVLYFSVDNNVNTESLYVSFKAKENVEGSKVLKIYLMRKGTRELVMFEDVYSDLLRTNSDLMTLDYNIDEVEYSDPAVDHWFIGWVEPEVFYEEKVEDNNIDLYATHSSSDVATYSEKHYTGDRWVEYKATVNQSTEVFDVGTNQGSAQTKLTLDLTTSSNYPIYANPTWAPLKVKNVSIFAEAGTTDWIHKFDFKANAEAITSSTSIGVSIGVGAYGATLGPSFSVSYSQNTTLGATWVTLYSVNGKYPRATKSKLPGAMANESNYYEYLIDVASVKGESGKRKNTMRWEFDFYGRDGWGNYNQYLKSGYNATSLYYY